MTEYESLLSNIYDIWRKTNHLLKNNELLKLYLKWF